MTEKAKILEKLEEVTDFIGFLQKIDGLKEKCRESPEDFQNLRRMHAKKLQMWSECKQMVREFIDAAFYAIEIQLEQKEVVEEEQEQEAVEEEQVSEQQAPEEEVVEQQEAVEEEQEQELGAKMDTGNDSSDSSDESEDESDDSSEDENHWIVQDSDSSDSSESFKPRPRKMPKLTKRQLAEQRELEKEKKEEEKKKMEQRNERAKRFHQRQYLSKSARVAHQEILPKPKKLQTARAGKRKREENFLKKNVLIKEEEALYQSMIDTTFITPDSLKKLPADITEEQAEYWLESRGLVARKKVDKDIGYTEYYADCLVEDENWHTPARSVVLAYAVCSPELRNFSCHADWAELAKPIFDLLHKEYLHTMPRATVCRISGDHIVGADIADKKSIDDVFPTHRKELVMAALVRAVRILCQSECKLFWFVAKQSPHGLYPGLKKYDCCCTHDSVDECVYAKALREEYSYMQNFLAVDGGDKDAEDDSEKFCYEQELEVF